MTAFDDLMAYVRDTEALAQVAGRLGWDQETVMPPGAADQRSEEIGALEGVLHSRRTDPAVGEWLATIDPATLDDTGRAQLRLIRRSHDRATRIPARLATALARETARAQGIWVEARHAESVADFLPSLSRIVDLRREEGQALMRGTGDAYDALMDDYEPGNTGAQTAALFDRLRPRLRDLGLAIRDSGRDPGVLGGDFPEAGQMALSAELAGVFGYDFSRGRIDRAVHPFSSGSGDDVRITTRVNPADPLNCIYSTIHETGHAVYEQAIAPEYRLTPAGQGASMGVHESQSRICENQLGRCRAFTGWLYGRMTAVFGDLGLSGPDEFHARVNRVSPGHIRTEADEVHYNLHVMMRFDLERALIRGDLAVGDLEAAWNDRFVRDFAVTVDRPSNGLLQDVHWSAGLFGYFPTYTLGNVYAGCLDAAMRRDLPGLDAALAEGDVTPALNWLREHLQRDGGLREPRDAIRHAIGGEPTEAPLLDYLEAKFRPLYGL